VVTNVDAAPPAITTGDEAQSVSDAEAAGIFSRSVVISGVRCTLAYVVFPWVLPLVGLSDRTGPVIGLIIGAVAIGFNIASIRRFQLSGHRWRWPITALNSVVIILLSVLMVIDIQDLL
jgi:hypothetical protein